MAIDLDWLGGLYVCGQTNRPCRLRADKDLTAKIRTPGDLEARMVVTIPVCTLAVGQKGEELVAADGEPDKVRPLLVRGCRWRHRLIAECLTKWRLEAD